MTNRVKDRKTKVSFDRISDTCADRNVLTIR